MLMQSVKFGMGWGEVKGWGRGAIRSSESEMFWDRVRASWNSLPIRSFELAGKVYPLGNDAVRVLLNGSQMLINHFSRSSVEDISYLHNINIKFIANPQLSSSFSKQVPTVCIMWGSNVCDFWPLLLRRKSIGGKVTGEGGGGMLFWYK